MSIICIITNCINTSNKLEVLLKQDRIDKAIKYLNPHVIKLLEACDKVTLECDIDIINLLPDNIENIVINEIKYISDCKYIKYPKNLKSLVCYADIDTRYLNSLPIGCQYLEVLRNNNKILILENLPISLIHLKIGNYIKGGNIIYPYGLKKLDIITVNIDNLDNLPSSLEILDACIIATKDNDINIFNIINSLPDNIYNLALQIESQIHKHIITTPEFDSLAKIRKLPNKLEILSLCIETKYLDECIIPDSLNIIHYLISDYDNLLQQDYTTLFDKILQTKKNITLCHYYNILEMQIMRGKKHISFN